MKKFKHEYHPDKGDEVETYIIIVDKDNKVSEVRPRCLGNFKKYITIGIVEYCEKWMTYSLVATENLPEYYSSVIFEEFINDMPEYHGEIVDCDPDEIKKAIRIRAKDLKYRT